MIVVPCTLDDNGIVRSRETLNLLDEINFFLWFRRKVTFIDFPVCLAMYMVQVLLQIHMTTKTWHNYIHSLIYKRVQERKYSCYE